MGCKDGGVGGADGAVGYADFPAAESLRLQIYTEHHEKQSI